MDAFTIKDLENLSGIKAHTIRIWEQRYSFLKPKRTQTNIRYYTNKELKNILNISLLHKFGYRISHIDKMDEQELMEKIISLSQAQAQQERIANELIQHMVDLELDKFECVLDNYIMTRGIDKTITQIIFPFLDRIGVLWQTNHINPTLEHLVSNIIRQKIIVGIEGVVSHLESKKTILLFLPEGEHHELGLLYLYYLLKMRGIKVLYVGANISLSDVEYICKMKKPDELYTHLTCITGSFSLEKFLARVHQRIPNIPLTISGQLARSNVKKIPSSVNFKRSLAEVMEYISRL
ncbi:MAG: MerR family transcriptional regulator [Bacteroidetes bacterium]|nr:MAG: MerR family transcriptional regulator [Bacteroidota bacterium]